MKAHQKALYQATQGNPDALISIVHTLMKQGVSIDRLADFAKKHYGIPRLALLALLVH